jgi:tRNA nucleotidyltransferase (CCA-adding enzyme)
MLIYKYIGKVGRCMETRFIKILDDVILSDNVVENFYKAYNNEFKKWIDETIPDIKKCMEREQNNPWHIYNVFDHILHSVEAINKMSKNLDYKERRLLAYTMLFHDIGKPDTCVFRKNKDTFYNHNVRSCQIIENLLPKLGFTDKESKEILALVFKHDAFIPVTNGQVKLDEKFINRQKEYFSKYGDSDKLMKYLVLVSKSDNYAQNPQMTGESLRILEKTEDLLRQLNNKR